MKPRICLVGQVVVDVLHLEGGPVVRLGGIFHAANVLSALKCDFENAYVAPKYLDSEILAYGRRLGALKVFKIGEVEGCPNVLLVGDPTEVGSQRYEFLLDKHSQSRLDLTELEDRFRRQSFSDVILFPGGFELRRVLLAFKAFKVCVHVDANFEPSDFDVFQALGRPLQTLILSTSSDVFLKVFSGSSARVCRAALKVGRSFLLKENRGGSRYFTNGSASPFLVPAFPRKIIHSVGVGDCFNAALVCLLYNTSPAAALNYASLLASEYACVLKQSLFQDAVDRTMKIRPTEVSSLQGVSVPWEFRRKIQVYIAAPDFKSADRSQIDRVASCLEYHNFIAHRPVLENGEIDAQSSAKKRNAAAWADIRMLRECQILLAVLIFDDPGSYIEIGYALEKGIPVIIYTPNQITENLLTYELPTLVSSDLNEVISELFKQAAMIYAD